MLSRFTILAALVAVLRPLAAQDVVVREAPEVRMAAAPDSNSPAFWHHGRLMWYGSHGSPWLSSGPDQFGPWETKPVTVPSKDPSPKWMEAVWPEANGTIWGWYHAEPVNLFPDSTLTAPKIGAAFSVDGGYTMTDLGFVLESGEPLNPGARNGFFAGGHGDPCVIVDRTQQYAYIFFGNYGGGTTTQGICVARMALADRDKPAGRVHKYFQGGWTEPGLGGRVTPIFPAKRSWETTTPDAFWGPSVHWNTHLNCYVMLMNRAQGGGWSQEGVYVSFCADLGQPDGWTTPRRILSQPELGDPGAYYAQVMGLEAGGTDRSAGQLARLYVRGTSRWELEFVAPETPPTSVRAAAGTESGTLEAGSRTWLSVSALGLPGFTYQWRKDGVPLPGATGATHLVRATSALDSGAYAVVVTNALGSVTSNVVRLTVTAPESPAPSPGTPAEPGTPASPPLPAPPAVPGAFLSNLSIRVAIRAEQPEFTLGFALRSPVAKPLIIRAIGPTLRDFGLADAAGDPRLEMFDAAGRRVAGNDDWQPADAGAFAAVGAFPLPAGSADAGLAYPALGGNGTAVVRAPGGGIVLAELYDPEPAGGSRLFNLSARAEVGAGDQVLVAGFMVTGAGTKRLLVRALGPWLGSYGVARPLPRPRLEIYDEAGRMVSANDGWDRAIEASFGDAGALTLTPGSPDAALVITVPAGTHRSALVRSADGQAGEVLFELYELP